MMGFKCTESLFLKIPHLLHALHDQTDSLYFAHKLCYFISDITDGILASNQPQNDQPNSQAGI